jgi:hypothetical protein
VGLLFLDAWQHRLRRCLLMCGFTVVGLPHCLAMVRTGCWPRSAADPGPRWAPGLPQHCANFIISLLRAGSIWDICVPPGGRAVKALPAARRTRLVVHLGAQMSPLVSDASGWAGPRWSAGATRVHHTDHDGGQRGRQCPARVCLTASSAPRAPPARRRRRLSGHPERDLRPVRTPQPLLCAAGDEPLAASCAKPFC